MSVTIMEISPASNTQWHPSSGKWHAETYVTYDGEAPTVNFRVVYKDQSATPWQPGTPTFGSGRYYYDFSSLRTDLNPVKAEVQAQNSTGSDQKSSINVMVMAT